MPYTLHPTPYTLNPALVACAVALGWIPLFATQDFAIYRYPKFLMIHLHPESQTASPNPSRRKSDRKDRVSITLIAKLNLEWFSLGYCLQ